MTKVIDLSKEKKVKNSSLTKQNIFDAATSLFAKHSYDSVRVSDIAKIAGIDAALIIRYFKSKENLYTEIIKHAYHDDMNEFIKNWPKDNAEIYIATEAIKSQCSRGNIKEIMELMYRSSSSEVTSKITYENIYLPFKELVVQKIGGNDAALKASMLIAYLGGIHAMKRNPDEPIFNQDNEEFVIEALSSAIRKCL